ncbi:hypothetical protein [Pseudonocardia sp. ICBG1293]|uniref:hypothetical protein n=1 Tax=Pseudonocardia sp. ICBG1293 TaxID=2844382 RepID=UPI001CCFD72D|nr:hypothetical protein [Pseudonocardia sp. ICBG1293]
MRKSVRGAIVGAALLPLAVAAPAAAFAGSTGYDEGHSDKDKGHSKHEGDKHKDKGHKKDGHHKKWDHKKHDDKKHDLALPAPLDSVVDLITGSTGGELPSTPVG